MSANNHEDADSRMCLHVLEALNEGDTIVLVRTVDTYVVVNISGSHCWVHQCVSGWILLRNLHLQHSNLLDDFHVSYTTASLVTRLNSLVRRNADARPFSHAQHSVSAVEFVRVKNKLTVAACEELVSNGGVG